MESFLLAETYVPKEELKLVALAVLEAQDIHEESWNREKGTYDKTDGQAVVEAVNKCKLSNPELWYCVISGWLATRWNESQDWAKAIINS